MEHDRRTAQGLLDGYPVVVRVPVQWGEMDAYGHVNNTVFFRYFECARVEYLERCGFTDSYEETGVGAILHSTRCRFRRALVHPDTVLVGARVREIEEDRFVHGYRLVSESLGDVAGEGSGVVVSFDYGAGEKAPIPDAVREAIAALEESADPVG